MLTCRPRPAEWSAAGNPWLTCSVVGSDTESPRMGWLRLHLLVVTALILGGHVAVLAASSTTLYFLALRVTGGGESCPLHRAGEETCRMAHCPIHSGASERAHEGDLHEMPGSSREVHQTKPSSVDECKLTCGQEDRSPVALFGTPGLLPTLPLLPLPAQVTGRLTSSVLGLLDGNPQVFVPPPRR